MRVILEPAFVLHTRPFRDTSLLVELLTRKYGRISVVARGAKTASSRFRGLLRPFVPLVVSYSGKTELMTLAKAEMINPFINITGKGLLSAIYLNELLMRLLQRADPHPSLFDYYHTTLINLQLRETIEPNLRYFEWKLLKELGYAFTLTADAFNQPILAENYYYLNPERGLLPLIDPNNEKNYYLGKHLLALAEQDLQSPAEYLTAKRLMRIALASLLGDKPVYSRYLF